MSIYVKLANCQEYLANNLKKTRYNEFGGFYYWNAEDIINTVRIALKEQRAMLLFTTNYVDGRIIVEVNFICLETSQKISVQGNVKEGDARKKMDSCQTSGTADSYAKKYALNNLFALSDVPDSDTMNQDFDNTKNKIIEEYELNRKLENENAKRKTLCKELKALYGDEAPRKLKELFNVNCTNDLEGIALQDAVKSVKNASIEYFKNNIKEGKKEGK